MHIRPQHHTQNAVASYRWASGWETGLRFRLVSGNLTTPVEEATFDADWGQHRPIQGAVRSERQPLFNQLDVRVEKSWVFKTWQFAVYLDVQNIYNSTNAEFTIYDYRFRESAPVPGIPFLPTFGFQGSF